MDESKRPAPNRLRKLAVLAVGGLFVLTLGWWAWWHYSGDLRAWLDLGLGKVRSAGPLAFFALMSLLPALGCPMSVFTLTAGPVFAPTLGMPLVIFLTLLSYAFNLALSYWLAHRALRPILARLVGWMGYTLPRARAADYRSLVFLLRVTPGPPFFLQSYLLGLAGIPFRIYFLISWLIAGLYGCAFVLFGDAVVHGRGKQVMLALGVFAVLTVVVQMLRRRARARRGLAAVSATAATSTEEKHSS